MLALVVVNAMKGSPWATFSVFATIPIAVAIGLYVRKRWPGRVLEASIIGMIALLSSALPAAAGSTRASTLRSLFDYTGPQLAAFAIAYGWLAAIIPVRLPPAPRGYSRRS